VKSQLTVGELILTQRRDSEFTIESEPNAFQRVFDMVISYGLEEYEKFRSEPAVHYNFFDDPRNDGRDAIFGLDDTLEKFVNALKSAAHGYGIEKRVLLLHGPVGSSKSTIARLLKKGLERYTATPAGAVFSLGWQQADGSTVWCPFCRFMYAERRPSRDS
jgi:serine protein kinase